MPPFRTHNDATNQPYYHQPRPASEGHWEGEGDGVLRSPFLHELIRVGSVMRGSVPFNGWAHEFRDAHKKKKELFSPVPFWAAHLTWCWTYPIRDRIVMAGARIHTTCPSEDVSHRLSRCCRREHAVSLLSPDENGGGSLPAGGSGKQHSGGACLGRRVQGRGHVSLSGSSGEALEDPRKTPLITSTRDSAPEGCSRGHRWQTLVS